MVNIANDVWKLQLLIYSIKNEKHRIREKKTNQNRMGTAKKLKKGISKTPPKVLHWTVKYNVLSIEALTVAVSNYMASIFFRVLSFQMSDFNKRT